MSDPRALLRSYLHQRIELGEHELHLERHTAEQIRELLGERPGSAPPPAAVAARRQRSPEPDRVPAGPAPVSADSGRLSQIGSLDILREDALACTRCELARTRTQVVFGEGNPSADLVVVGEAPGADEDATGRPFVGRAGKLLNVLLAAVGFAREEVYICNVLKCRPPGNRNPLPVEVETCSPYLLRQVELVKPKVILACGSFASQTLLQTTTPIGQLRGKLHRFHDVPLIATYHPAALLRNSAWIRSAWDDLQLLRRIFDSSAVAPG